MDNAQQALQAQQEPNMYRIWDSKEQRFIGKPYTSGKRCRTRCDKLDNEYGAYRYRAIRSV